MCCEEGETRHLDKF